MKISDMLHGAMLKYLHTCGITGATEITGYYENTSQAYGCETCGPEYEYTIYIYYTTPGQPWSSSYTFVGKFGDLIQALDRMTEEPS